MENLTLLSPIKWVKFRGDTEYFAKIISDKNFMDQKNYIDNDNFKVLWKVLWYLEWEACDSSQLLYGFIVWYDLASIMSLSSFKETLFWDTINANDMEYVKEIYDEINVIEPKIFHKNGSFIEKRWWARLLSEIKNWIAHDHYLICKEWIYINNPQSSTHKIDFEALISRKFFDIIYKIATYNNRRPYAVFMDSSVDWWKWYIANKGKIKILEAKKKYDPINCFQIWKKILNDINCFDFDKLWSEYDIHGISQYQSNLLANFFWKYDFNLENFKESIRYIDKNLLVDLDIKMKIIMDVIINNIRENISVNWTTNIIYNKESVLNDLMKFEINFWFTDECMLDLGGEAIKKLDFLKEYVKWNYSDWIIHDSNKIQKTFGNNPDFIYECYEFKKVAEHEYKSLEFALEILPNYLKMLYLMKKYTSDSKIKNWTLDGNTSVAGHIRNALSHRNSFILPWVDSILLVDESQERWKPDLKKIYSLQELYEGRADLSDPWEEVI